MSGARWIRGAVVVVAGIVLAVGGAVGAKTPAFARREAHSGGSAGRYQRHDDELYGCDRTFGRQPEGHLDKRAEPPADHDVRPGDTIRVTLVWEPRDWSDDRLHKVLDCVAVDGELVRSMQGGESPTANDGQFSRVYTVPDDSPDGAEICDQAMLSGPSPRADYDRQISNQVCHTVSRHGGGGRPPCRQTCAEPKPCDRCDRTPPPCDRGCGDKAPCDRGCADNPPCDRGCGDACDKQEPCEQESPHRRDDGDGKDCDCRDRRRHHHRKLIEIL